MNRRNAWNVLGSRIVLLAAIGFLAVGCASQLYGKTAESRSARGYAQVWADNCVRCHYTRSPASYSDERWEATLLHMRVRANLLAEDYRTVLEFVKAGN